MRKRIICRMAAVLLGAVCFLPGAGTGFRGMTKAQAETVCREEETVSEDTIASEQVAGDNVYPAKTTGEYYIKAVYKGGSKNGQYDQYKMDITGIDKGKSINTMRSVYVTAVYSGNAGNTLITNMSHTSPKHAALYQNVGNSPYNYLYASFRLNVPTGYAMSGVSYTGQGTRNTQYHLYLLNDNMKFDASADTKTWSAASADLLTTASSTDGNARYVAIRSMVDIFYHAGVGTTSTNFANAHGKVTQSMTLSPITYTVVYNANGGTGAPANQTITYDTPAVLSTVVPLRTGYQFAGWDINGVTYGSGYHLTEQQVNAISHLQGEKVTAKAQWKPIQYSVCYDGNGATEGNTVNQDVLTYDVEYHLQSNGFKRQFRISYDLDGGTLDQMTDLVAANFRGWLYVGAGGQSRLMANNASFKNLTDKAQTITLYAQWDDAPLYLSLCDPVKEKKVVPAKNAAGEEGYETTEYEFLGWREEGAKEEQGYLGPQLYVTRDMKLAAVWKETVTFSKTVSTDSQAGQIIDKLDKIEKSLKNGYNLSDEQAEKILEAIENGSAFTLNMEGTEYTIVRNEDGTLSIRLASVPAGTQKLVIPSEVKIGSHVYPITEIYQGCFKNNKELKEVEIGNNIVRIGDEAFRGCTSLEKVKLAQGLVAIGNRAFQGCTKLTQIKLPTTLLTIGQYAFYKCSGLQKIRIPDSVLKVGKYAFGSCIRMKTVNTSKNCTIMGESVFSGCKSLEKVTLKAALTEIPAKTFLGCKKLGSITIPKKIMTIRTKAFYQCSSLKTVKIKSNYLSAVGKSAFKKCGKGIRFTVPRKKKAAYAKLLKGRY